jgi:cytochrome c556
MTRFQIFPMIALMATVAHAHDGVKNPAVMARMAAMDKIGAATKILGQMARGATPFDAAMAQRVASEIAVHSATVPALFEVREDDPKSEALPAIWEDFADFTAKSEAMGRVAEAATHFGTEPELRAAIADLGQACKACHSRYRE